MHCSVCHEETVLDQEKWIPYPSSHPIFESLSIVSCDVCGSGWVPTPPSAEGLKKYYEEEANRVLSLFGILEKPSMTLERLQSLARWGFVLRFIRKKVFSICDIGAGYGATFEVAKHLQLAVDYFAYETSPGMRGNIKKMGGMVKDDFFCHSDNQQYDLVWASHILEHYPDPDILLGGMKRHMKPDGFGFIEVPLLDYKYKIDLTQHLLFFSVQGLKKAIERNGFRVLRIDSAGQTHEKLKQRYSAVAQSNSFRARLKRWAPGPVVRGQRYLRGLANLVLAKKAPILAKDLENRTVYDAWELENYGGNERCWVRAVFTLPGDNV